MRKLVTIKTITDIQPIPEADAIDVATVNHGWKVVVKKGEYKIGDNVLYVEVDSWVPNRIAPFLSKNREPREYNGVLGERLKTQKFRGQLSQGLILPLSILTGYIDEALDGDFSNILGVQKWEAPVPTQLSGDLVGGFPSRIPKTDQERCVCGDSIIMTDMGELSIKDIISLIEQNQKIKVLSYNHITNKNEFKTVIGGSKTHNNKKWIKIKTKTKTIICTSDHKIYNPKIMAYRNAEYFKVSEELQIYK